MVEPVHILDHRGPSSRFSLVSPPQSKNAAASATPSEESALLSGMVRVEVWRKLRALMLRYLRCGRDVLATQARRRAACVSLLRAGCQAWTH